MKDPHTVLKWSLLGGAAYFLGVAIAHFLGVKIPLLYVYYDLPSTAYQDRIISFTSFGWAMFFVAGYSSLKRNSLRSVRYIVIAGAGAVAGLCFINLFTNFSTLTPEFSLRTYWIQTLLLSLFVGWLAFLYILAKRI